MFEFFKKCDEEIYNEIVNEVEYNMCNNRCISIIQSEIEKIIKKIFNESEIVLTNVGENGRVYREFNPTISRLLDKENEFKTFLMNNQILSDTDINDYWDIHSGANFKKHGPKNNTYIEITDALKEKSLHFLFNLCYNYYRYEFKKKPTVKWDENYFKQLLQKPQPKIIEIEKIDKLAMQQKDEEIAKLSTKAKEKDEIITNLKEQNKEYEYEAEKYREQTNKIESQYKNKLKEKQNETTRLKQELEKQKYLITTKEEQISELQELSKASKFRTFFNHNKKKILYSLLAISLVVILSISIYFAIYQSSNKLNFNNSTDSTISVSIGENLDDSNLVIPSTYNGKTVTKIVDNGRKGNDNIVSIEIPDTIEVIDSHAFEGFSKLEQIIISKNSKLQMINSNAFTNCQSLKSFYIPENVYFIEMNAFKNCLNLGFVSFENQNDWCVDQSSSSQQKNYQNVSLLDQTNNAQLLTSINSKFNWYKKFYINYNLNGGYVASNPTFFTYGDQYNINNPSKTGYTFIGWTDNNENTPIKNLSIPIYSKNNREYTANWTPIKYSISYETYGGSHNNPTSYTIENEDIILSAPVKSNNKFLGWYDNADFSGEAIERIPKNSMGNIILYAKWTTNIEISNLSELIDFVNNDTYWGGNITLTNDIDLNGMEWTPIGTYKNQFSGNFNGNGHILFNFKISKNNTYNGFFGYTSGATIQNVGLEDYEINISSFSSNTYAGGIVGYATNNTTIKNCYTTCDISVSASDSSFAGGIIGYSYNTNIEYCYSTGEISTNSKISSYNNGYIDYACAGGIVGNSYNNTTIKHSFSLGNITAEITNSVYGNSVYNWANSICNGESNIANCYYYSNQIIIQGRDTINVSGDSLATIYSLIFNNWDKNIWNIYTNQKPELIKKY